MESSYPVLPFPLAPPHTRWWRGAGRREEEREGERRREEERWESGKGERGWRVELARHGRDCRDVLKTGNSATRMPLRHFPVSMTLFPHPPVSSKLDSPPDLPPDLPLDVPPGESSLLDTGGIVATS